MAHRHQRCRMPGFTKSPPELVERFRAITSDLPDAEPRQMFGYPAVFVGGNLITSLHESRWIVRLPEEDRATLLALPGAGPFEPMPGRPMNGYVALSSPVVDDDAVVRQWVDRAMAFGRSLPPKAPKASYARRACRGPRKG
jgi:TfoX/Sxy family transcriptional regulator of competence genes